MQIRTVTAALLLATSAVAERIIVDNTPASPHTFSTTGAWAAGTTAEGYCGANYLSADGNSAATASWQPLVSTSGYYKIYMKWTAVSSRPDRVPVEITYDGGAETDSTRRINQKINGGVWTFLGTYYLQAGTNNAVSIEASDAGRICADAVLFDLSSADTNSPAAAAPTTPRVEYTTEFTVIDRPTDVRFRVYKNTSPLSDQRIDQTATNSIWFSLGTYSFSAGTDASVLLSAPDAGFTAADAVKFELASDTNVSVIVDNDLPEGSPHVITTAGSWTPAVSPDGYYGTNYVCATGPGNALRWRPSLDTAGDYNVYVRWPGDTIEADRPEEVLIVRTDSGEPGANAEFELRVEGNPFYVKGSCGPEAVEEIAAIGGNTVRAYSVQSITPDFMRQCSDAGVKVLLGVWLTQARDSNETWYDNPANVSNQLETLKTQIDEYKEFDSLLAWVVGNEIDPLTVPNPEPVYRAIDEVARYMRETDHYHPTLTSHAGANLTKMQNMVQWAPHVDIIGLNSYGSNIAQIRSRLLDAGWIGPAMLTEFFLRQPFDSPSTDWGAKIEPLSAIKYSRLLEMYNDDILTINDRLLGSFVFKGALGGFRVTHTWYPILDENFKPTPSYDAMAENWGAPVDPAQAAPRVDTIKLNGLAPEDDVLITNAIGIITATVTVDAPTNSTLEYLVEMRTDVSTDAGFPPPVLEEITITQDSVTPSKFYIKLADFPNGDYRLYYYVRRTDGAAPGDYVSVGTANIPFRKLATNTYQLVTSSSPPDWGTVSPTAGTYLANADILLQAEASPYYHFVEWSGDFSGTLPTTNLHINSNLNIQAIFAENQTTNGTPEWWLAQYGLETDSAAALSDTDFDGLAAWQEYIAGTDPTNSTSALRVTASPQQELNWQAVSGRVYSVFWTTNLLESFQPLETNLTSGTFTDVANKTSPQTFYMLEVKMAP